MQRAILGFSCLLSCGFAVASVTPLDNFVLLDQNGKAQELYYQSDAGALVVVAHDQKCASTAEDLRALAGLRSRFEAAGARFYLLNSDSRTTRSALRELAATAHIDLPILHDDSQLIAPALGLTHAGEALVIDTGDWSVRYRGPVAGTEAPAGRGLADILDKTLNGSAGQATVEMAGGCAIDFEPVDTGITYTGDVAPILREKCAVCHTPGGIAPWAMTGYDMVHGFAPMIREVLRTRRMPPWHADPETGSFQHARGLDREQVRTLVSWVEAGAPRGEGEDLLAAQPVTQVEWPLGKPDLILEIPAYDVPATGVVDYQFPRIANPLGAPVWVRAATVVPGDRSAVHHVLMGASEPGVPIVEGRENVFDNYIIGYAPGNESAEMPAGTGVFVQPGSEFLFQMHYTPYGKPNTDRTRVGLYFHRDKPANYLRHIVVINPTLSIPANTESFEVSAYFEFDKPATVFSLVPHAHYRGKSSRFELLHADGRRELVLSVPNYDFNWQRTYEFSEPRQVAAGTRLVHTTVYDNSVKNARNPDPERTVPWGLQSHDEMLYGAVSYSWRDETSDKPIHDKGLADTYQWVGFFDRDMDGRLAWKELPEGLKKRLVQGFKSVDSNGDGGLDAKELYAINRRQAEDAAAR